MLRDCHAEEEYEATANIEHQTSNIEHRTSNIEHRTSNIEHRTSNGGGGGGGGGSGGGGGGGSMVERNLDRATVFFAVLFAVNTLAILKV